MLLVPNTQNKANTEKTKRNFSYQELLDKLNPDKLQQEIFLKKCQFIDLQNPKPELILRYSKNFVKQNPNFNLYELLVELEQSFNQKRQTLVFNFSNYTEILRPELLQTLNVALAENEVLGFIQTFFSFT